MLKILKENHQERQIRLLLLEQEDLLTPEEIEKLNTDVVVVFHGTYDAQMIMKLYHKNLADDKAKLENQPPIILEGYREDGDSQGVENKRWREALDGVNKNTITKLTEIPDLKDIWDCTLLVFSSNCPVSKNLSNEVGIIYRILLLILVKMELFKSHF